jgi:hypothetical protein
MKERSETKTAGANKDLDGLRAYREKFWFKGRTPFFAE